jgi:hypothetical protein
LPGYVTQTLLAQRGIFDRVGLFNEAMRHGDGTEWFLRAAEKGAMIELLPDVLVNRRIHERNSSRAVNESRHDYLRILKASLDRRRQLGGGSVKPYTFSRPIGDKRR